MLNGTVLASCEGAPLNTIFMFPGQNSRYPEMIEKLTRVDHESHRIVTHASNVLGRDLHRQFAATNAEMFARNRDVQVGVFLAGYLHADALQRRGVTCDRSVGLSLGEYNHLVDIGALTFEAALALLEARGDAYDDSPAGVMAAVFPVTPDEAEDAVSRAGREHLSVAMRNTPSQQVLSGAREPLDEAVRILEDECAAQHVVIDARLPIHSPLFATVSRRFRPALERVAWRTPRSSYLPNIMGQAMPAPTGADFVDLLARHVCEPVLWRQSIELLADETAVFVETGPGDVLVNMLSRRWIKRRRFNCDGPGGPAAALDALRGSGDGQ